MAERFGLSVAVTTPFTAGGEIDTALLAAQIKACLAEGCARATLFGTTGEGCSVGTRERETVFSALVQAGIAPRQLIAGVLTDAADDAVAQCASALDHGASYLMLAPPHYFKGVGEEGLFQWFSAVLSQLGGKARGVLLYHIPSVTAVPLPHALITRLMKAFPSVVGVKDSGGDFAYTERLLELHRDKIILIGDERDLARGVRMGGQGAISGLANLAAPALKTLIETGKEDNRITALVETVLQHAVTPAVKVLVAHVREDARWLNVRPPLVSLAAQARQSVVAAYDSHFTARPNRE